MIQRRRRSIEERLDAAGLPRLPRLSWLEIDLDALASNVAVIRSTLEHGVLLAGVVKADAYGHGLVRTAQALAAAGVDRLCTATFDEALVLRRHLDTPILVLFRVPPGALREAAHASIEVTLSSEEELRDALETLEGRDASAVAGPALIAHLELDTGLRRAGVRPECAAGVARRIAASGSIRLGGVWTHFASAHDAAVTSEQVGCFSEGLAAMEAAGVRAVLRHVSASGAVLGATAPQLDMVRVGLSLYGILPGGLTIPPSLRQATGALRPVMSLVARAIRIEDIGVGEAVGYGGLWRAQRPSRIATLPVGYGDGWSYLSAGRVCALVRGRRVPLVGSVAMDAVAADVTDVPGVDPEDEFVLLGAQGSDEITATELARARTTIPHEVVTTMAHRLPRVYDAGAEVVCVRTLAGDMRPAGMGAE